MRIRKHSLREPVKDLHGSFVWWTIPAQRASLWKPVLAAVLLMLVLVLGVSAFFYFHTVDAPMQVEPKVFVV